MIPNRLTVTGFWLILLVSLFSIQAHSQTASRFSKIIRDASGQVVTGLNVDLYLAGTTTKAYDCTEDVSNAGTYYKDDVAIGVYDVYVNSVKKLTNYFHGDVLKFGGRYETDSSSTATTYGGRVFVVQGNLAQGLTVSTIRDQYDTVVVEIGIAQSQAVEYFGDIGIGGSVGDGGDIDSSGWAIPDDTQQTELGRWFGDSIAFRLVEWVKPFYWERVFDSSSLTTSSQRQLFFNNYGWKKYQYYVNTSHTNSTHWWRAVSDSAENCRVVAVTYESMLNTNNPFLGRKSRQAGGIRLYDSGDTYIANNNYWNMSTVQDFDITLTSFSPNNEEYEYDEFLAQYHHNELPFRWSSGSGTILSVGYIWVYYAESNRDGYHNSTWGVKLVNQ